VAAADFGTRKHADAGRGTGTLRNIAEDGEAVAVRLHRSAVGTTGTHAEPGDGDDHDDDESTDDEGRHRQSSRRLDFATRTAR
jgi:hypothetical protein